MKSTNMESQEAWGKNKYDFSYVIDDYPERPRNTKESTVWVIEDDGVLTNASFPFAYYNPFKPTPGKLKNFH